LRRAGKLGAGDGLGAPAWAARLGEGVERFVSDRAPAGAWSAAAMKHAACIARRGERQQALGQIVCKDRGDQLVFDDPYGLGPVGETPDRAREILAASAENAGGANHRGARRGVQDGALPGEL
jgi:hypothetical protein